MINYCPTCDDEELEVYLSPIDVYYKGRLTHIDLSISKCYCCENEIMLDYQLEYNREELNRFYTEVDNEINY